MEVEGRRRSAWRSRALRSAAATFDHRSLRELGAEVVWHSPRFVPVGQPLGFVLHQLSRCLNVVLLCARLIETMRGQQEDLRNMRALALLLALLSCSAIAEDDDAKPCVLGYCKGTTIDQEPININDVDGLPYIEVEHEAFDSLAVYFTPNHGVCRLLGLSYVDGDWYGSAHRRAFDRFVEFISSEYGEPSVELDFVRKASIGKKLQEWLMRALWQILGATFWFSERPERPESTLATYWFAELPRLPEGMEAETLVLGIEIMLVELPKGLTGIGVEALPGAIGVGYEFDNMDKCRADAELIQAQP